MIQPMEYSALALGVALPAGTGTIRRPHQSLPSSRVVRSVCRRISGNALHDTSLGGSYPISLQYRLSRGFVAHYVAVALLLGRVPTRILIRRLSCHPRAVTIGPLAPRVLSVRASTDSSLRVSSTLRSRFACRWSCSSGGDSETSVDGCTILV